MMTTMTTMTKMTKTNETKTLFAISDCGYPGSKQLIATEQIKPFTTIIKEDVLTYYFDPISHPNKDYPLWYNNKLSQHQSILDKNLSNNIFKLMFNLLIYQPDVAFDLLKNESPYNATRLNQSEQKLIILGYLVKHLCLIEPKINIPVQQLIRLYDILLTNSFGITSTNGIKGLAMFQQTSFINHSCDPNAFWCIKWNWNSNQGPSMMVYALKTIEKYEPITISYGPFAFLSSKIQRSLSLGFDCICEKCNNRFMDQHDQTFFHCHKSVGILKKLVKDKMAIPHVDLIKTLKSFQSIYQKKDNSAFFHSWNTFLVLLYILGVNFRTNKIPLPNKFYLIHYEPYLRDQDKNKTKIVKSTSLLLHI